MNRKLCPQCGQVYKKSMIERPSIFNKKLFCSPECGYRHKREGGFPLGSLKYKKELEDLRAKYSIINSLGTKTHFSLRKIKNLVEQGKTKEEILGLNDQEDWEVQNLDSDPDSLFWK